MTYLEQLESWVKGESIHDGDKENGQCCPDFSCCVPEMNTPVEQKERFFRAYKEGKHKIYEGMLMEFLSKAINLHYSDKQIHIAGLGDRMQEN